MEASSDVSKSAGRPKAATRPGANRLKRPANVVQGGPPVPGPASVRPRLSCDEVRAAGGGVRSSVRADDEETKTETDAVLTRSSNNCGRAGGEETRTESDAVLANSSNNNVQLVSEQASGPPPRGQLAELGSITALSAKQPWPFVGRVICRDAIRNYSTPRGDGKLFELWVTDSSGELIRFTIFNEAVDKFSSVIAPGYICRFSGGKIKPANAAFAPKGAEIDVSFGAGAEIGVFDAVPAFPVPKLTMLTIAELAKCRGGATTTFAGVIKTVGVLKRITTKRGSDTQKREFLVVDDSDTSVLVTVWGAVARRTPASYQGRTVLVKDGYISDYNNQRSINAGAVTMLLHEPELSRTKQLNEWYVGLSREHAFTSLGAE